VTAPKPLNWWQQEHTPASLPLHIRRNMAPGPAGCWLWMRSLSPDGYGWASLAGRTSQAHRLVYVLINGDPPSGLTLDHLCRVRHCVNPDHLEPVTNAENLRRGNTPTGWDRCQKCGGEFSWIGRRARQRRCLPCRDAYEADRRPQLVQHMRLRRLRLKAGVS
jgi:hypothetical protein